ncbi:PRTRC system ThiF family protein [Granulicella sp. L60]|uniref:PRTRC system ThiF family protein n=1 Tax=Granulicella sp. L60 TaxID=1641866 RepID=UPI00131CDF63|nr:PRTRC system ThiF family protein [Granulicella sp. L60]
MAIEHKLHDTLLRPQQAIRILVVGAGGTGSAIMLGLPYLHQAMRVWGHRGLEVMLADGDAVSATNCVRQPFATSDIGLNKAVVLVNRVNLFWGVTWRAYPQHLHKDSLNEQANPHIVVGCVDTRAARANIANGVASSHSSAVYWLDIGNNADSGQYVLGQPLNSQNSRKKERLRTVAELYPEIADPGVGEDALPSCSAAEALHRQEPFINQVLAQSALVMLTRLIRYGTLTHHGAFYNGSTGRMTSLPVDPELWSKTRKRSRKHLSQVRQNLS